ncbi:MAG: alpha/beta fold hydrolase [Oscillochloridaceae bacterium umkhey_bin13]
MEPILRRRLKVGDPLSRVLIPLTLGLTRKAMLRTGVFSSERRLAGMPVHFYIASARRRTRERMPVVLLHGIADNALTWAFTIHGMSRIGPVYALDLPGFGQSAYPPQRRYATIAEHVEVVADLIRTVAGRPALVVGNSMGGWIAARLAELHPELVRGIVLLDPGGAMLTGYEAWEPFVRTVQVPDLATVRRIYRQMFGHVPLALYLGQHSFQDMFLRDSVQHFIAAATVDDFFTAEDLRKIAVPTALVWGERDHFLPAGSFEFFRDHLTNPAVLTLPGCGHLPQRERPLQVVRFTRQFAEDLLRQP